MQQVHGLVDNSMASQHLSGVRGLHTLATRRLVIAVLAISMALTLNLQ